MTVEVRNATETKKLEYSTIRPESFAFGKRPALIALRDEFDNGYNALAFGLGERPVGGIDHKSVHPGKSVQDVIAFEEPIEKASKFTLTLPGRLFGADQDIVFLFEREAIRVDR